MNDLKLIDFEKPKRNLMLIVCVIAMMLTACECKKVTPKLKSTEPLPITYITTDESRKRENWFNNYKYPILDSLTMKEEGEHENKGLDFESLSNAMNFFDSLTNYNSTITGVRVYFASQPIKSGRCGKLTLIFNSTSGADNADVKNYYVFRNGVLNPQQVDMSTARTWVHNYQQKKRARLSKYTMDSKDSCEETKHIWFSKKQIVSIVKEINYQMGNHSNIVKKFGIRFTSYTDTNYIFPKPNAKPVIHHKRLTIGFTFIDWENDDIGIKQIDPIEFIARFKETENKWVGGDTFDTGFPAPPPPGNESMAALDIEN